MPPTSDHKPPATEAPAAPFLELRLDVRSAADADDAELDAAARDLRAELLELDVRDVRRLTGGPAPAGTRAIELLVAGGLLVSTAQEVIRAVVQTAAGWASRREARSVTLTLGGDTVELSDVCGDEHRELVELFLARHAEPQA